MFRSGAPKPRILELDGLRALAVLAVISFHYTLGTPLGNRASALGWVGVDLFFVLSGYLITSILLASRDQAGYFSSFYTRRALRILPVYFVLLGVYALAARIWGGPQPWSYWAMHAAFLSSTVEYFHYWNLAAPAFVFAGLTVLWSLSIEEQFYLLWAPVVKWLRPWGLWLCLGLVIAGAPALRFWIHGQGFREYRFLPARFDSLAWGAVLALAWRQPRLRQPRALLAALAGSGLVLAVLVAATGGRRESLWFATFGYSLLAIFFAASLGWVLARAGSNAWACRLLCLRPLRYLGRISYSVYLVHYPMLLLSGAALAPFLGHDLDKAAGTSALRAVLGLGATLGLAAASWRFLETPMQALKNRWPAEPGSRGLRMIQVEVEPTTASVPL